MQDSQEEKWTILVNANQLQNQDQQACFHLRTFNYDRSARKVLSPSFSLKFLLMLVFNLFQYDQCDFAKSSAPIQFMPFPHLLL